MVDFSSIKEIEIPEGKVKSISSNGTILWKLDEGGLPSEYQQVEYIESSGTQYINTNFKPTGNTKVEFEYSNYSNSVDGVMFGGYDGNWNANSFGLYANSTSSQWGYWLHYCSNTRVGSITTLSNAKIVIDKGKTYVNDNLMVSPSILSFDCPNYMYIFTGNGYSQASSQPSRYRLHYFKIWNNDSLVRDFVPCYRKSDSVIGLYDLVSQTFFINQGSGSFIKGGDV